MVRPVGLEPTTFCSEDRRSNPLSYGRLVAQGIITDVGDKLLSRQYIAAKTRVLVMVGRAWLLGR